MADNKDAVSSWEKLGISTTGMGKVPGLLDLIWNIHPRPTICLVGETGIGKTPVVHQWCAKHKGFMRVLNFGHMTQEEISMIMFSDSGDTFDFVPPRWLLELNEQAEAKGLAVLFLDEWNRGDKALVNALFTLTDERRIHNFHLHKNVVVIAAMNPSDGSYLVNEAEKDHAIRKRLNFVYCVHDLAAWVDYAKTAKFHPLVPAFIKAVVTFLYDKGARDSGKAFPCPSNWEKVSNILIGASKSKLELTDDSVATLIQGQIGLVAADKFLQFVGNQNTVIQPSEVLTSYTAMSEVRHKVADLLNCSIDPQTRKLVKKADKKNSASVINELNRGLAIELFSSLPDITATARYLALYISDLPVELAIPLASQYFREAREGKPKSVEKYFNNLSDAMAKFPPYEEAMKAINAAHRSFKKSAMPETP